MKRMQVLFLALLVSSLTPTSVSSADAQGSIDRREVEFANGDVVLAGVLLVPAGGRNLPGVVIIHGSGASDRNNAWAAGFANGLTERGFAVLLPDKRGSGRSGGDWRTANFEALADDAIAGVKRLQEEEMVDSRRVGVLGLSQGGHIAPLAASRSDDIAFVISASASTVPIVEQIMDEVEKQAERAGLSPEQIDEVNALHRLAIHYGRTGEGWETYTKKLEEARRGSWAGHGIAEGFPDQADHWVWSWGRMVAGYDPLPYWQQVRVPVVLAYGARDTQIRVAKSVARIEKLLTEERERDFAILVFGDSGHALRHPSTNAIRGDFLDFLQRWVLGALRE